MVVIAGMGHINESKESRTPGGVMGYRFRELTGIDPLTVDTSSEAHIDPKLLSFEAAAPGRLPPSYLLQDASGKAYGTERYDLSLYVPAPAHRNDGEPSWLELGGLRRRTAVAASECRGHEPCLVEARRAGEAADAVPADRCVIQGELAGCTLFLRAGEYDVLTFDAEGAEVSRRRATISGG